MEHPCSKIIQNFLLLTNTTYLFGLDMKGSQQLVFSSLFFLSYFPQHAYAYVTL